MKKALTLMTVVLTLGLALGSGDADAKRLGGGRSSGTQRQMSTAAPASTPSQASASSPTAATKAPMNTPAPASAQPKRSWMGPIAGLAAGLGLAALASHFGFGEELASMLVIGLAFMAVMLVIRMIMRKRAGSLQPALASTGGTANAGAGTQQPESIQRGYDISMPDSRSAPFIGSAIGSGVSTGEGASQPTVVPAHIPANFDVDAFVRNAKVNFIRLQASHDAGNVEDLREFTTPEMFAELKMDLTERGTTAQHTDVVSLNAHVLDVLEDSKLFLVSVRFTGLIREELGAAPEAFDEVWHLVKQRVGGQGWVLSGIQQTA